MKTTSNLKDTVATSAVLIVTVAAIFGAAFNSNDARADSNAVVTTIAMEPIVVSASRMDTAALDTIVITASRTN